MVLVLVKYISNDFYYNGDICCVGQGHILKRLINQVQQLQTMPQPPPYCHRKRRIQVQSSALLQILRHLILLKYLMHTQLLPLKLSLLLRSLKVQL